MHTRIPCAALRCYIFSSTALHYVLAHCAAQRSRTPRYITLSPSLLHSFSPSFIPLSLLSLFLGLLRQMSTTNTDAAKHSECVQVTVRCRPLNPDEVAAKHSIVVRVNPAEGTVVLTPPASNSKPLWSQGEDFHFRYCFWFRIEAGGRCTTRQPGPS